MNRAALPLSRSETGKAWLKQFSADDASAAAKLLDAMLLLNDTDVADAIRDGINNLAEDWRDRRRSLALYAERDFYNQRRPHSALGDRTPDEACAIEIRQKNLAA